MPRALPNPALERAFWLASRGAQQTDLAVRFASEASARGLKVLALKGISIAEELYGGAQNRPMADIDFLVVDAARFEAAAGLARSLGLVEAGAADHALMFREPSSGVVLELHIALTACPGLFTVDHQAAWERRAPVAASPMFRLSAEDLVVHLSLHTAFQHAFVAGEYHYRDFVRALEVFEPPVERILERAREWGALAAVGAMAFSCREEALRSKALADLLEQARPHCPAAIRRFLEAQGRVPAPMSVPALARVRYQLAPSKWRFLRGTLLPKALPGRTAPKRGSMMRLSRLVDASLFSPVPPRP